MELLTFVNAIRSRSVRQKSQHTTEFEWRRKLASTFFFSKKERDFEGLKGFLHTSSTTTRVSGRKRKKKKLA